MISQNVTELKLKGLENPARELSVIISFSYKRVSVETGKSYYLQTTWKQIGNTCWTWSSKCFSTCLRTTNRSAECIKDTKKSAFRSNRSTVRSSSFSSCCCLLLTLYSELTAPFTCANWQCPCAWMESALSEPASHKSPSVLPEQLLKYQL